MWQTLVKLAFSAALIWLVLRHQNAAALIDQMLMVEWWALALAIAILGALTLALALRWSAVLQGMRTPLGFDVTFPLVLIGQFFNQMLPSATGGDVMRMWLSHRAGLSGKAAISSVMIDRISGLTALLVLATLGLPALFFAGPGPGVTSGVLLVLLLGYVAIATVTVLDRLPSHLKRFKLVRGFAQFAADFRSILLSPGPALRVTFYSLVNQIGNAVVVWILARGLHVDVSLPECLIILSLSGLVQTLPVSIAGWGLREGFFVSAFALVGVGSQEALAISVLFGIINILVALPGSIVWLLHKEGNSFTRVISGYAEALENARAGEVDLRAVEPAAGRRV